MNPGDLINDKYRIEKLLGQGGMGAVYLAENQDVGRKVAIKLLRPEFAAEGEVLARFKSEARAAGAIGHPGIVDVLDMGVTAQGAPFIVMERLQGMTLRQRLATAPPLTIAEAIELIARILDVLEAAHAAGVIHRDLKPDNLFLTTMPAGGIKILDFGVSKFRDGPGAHLTQTGQVMGTPLYMSPEQARGSRDVNIATDLYSMGAILYEMLSGRPPFPGQSYTEILSKLLTESLPPLDVVHPGLPKGLTSVVERMLAKDPAARFSSAAEAAAALRASLHPEAAVMSIRTLNDEVPALGKTTPSAKRAPVADSSFIAPMPKREGLIAGGIVLVGVAISAGIWWASRPRSSSPDSVPPPVWTAPVTPTPPVASTPTPPAPAQAPTASAIPTPTPPVPPPRAETHAPSSPKSHPRETASATNASPASNRFVGTVEEDDILFSPLPSSQPHRRFEQGVTLLDAGGRMSLTLDGPPPCTLHLTHVGVSSFAVDPNQSCPVATPTGTRTMQILVGKGSVESRGLSVSLTGKISVPAGLLQFSVTYSGTRGH